jgi:serine/threonine-protein kinase RIM15
MGPSTPGSIQSHLRRPSEYSAIDRFKANHLEGDVRRNSMPSRLRTASVSSADAELAYSGSDPWPHSSTPAFSPAPQEMSKRSHDIGSVDRAVVCLIAEDNPISAKILETLLVRLGCRCVIACDGAEAISTAHGDISKWSPLRNMAA